MKSSTIATLAVALAATLLSPLSAIAEDSQETRIERLELELAEVRRELGALREAHGPAEQVDNEELERRIAILADEIERLKVGEAAAEADASQWGMGPAASKIYRTERGVSIGGYGEMLYQNFADERDDGVASGKLDQIDFLRAIVYFGYKFNDDFLFNSEIEFEHAATGESGSASVEFAYLDYLWRPELNLRAGLLLVPMGHVNELHEPTTFLGAHRPETERQILPTTWRENGFGAFGEHGPVRYKSYLVNGLRGERFEASGLRSGRQKGSKAAAEDFAWVGRLDYVRPGVLAGGSLYYGNSGQGLDDGLGVGTFIAEGHLEWSWQGLRVRGLLAHASLDDVAELNAALGLSGADSVGESLFGAYLEAGYDVLSRGDHGEMSLTPYFRWETIDTQSEVPSGFTRDPANDRDLVTVGLDFKPIDPIVIKLDWRGESDEAGSGIDQFNVALGYIF